MTFTESLFKDIEGIFEKILSHPFLKGLTDGTLPEESFKFYVIQDALYLRDFAKGLAILGARSDRDDDLLLFVEHAREAIVVERALHEEFFKRWELKDEDIYSTPMAPTNLLYTSYLLRIALERPYEEGVFAFLPCYWIYLEVGKNLERRGSRNPLYQKWIDTYSSQEYEKVVRKVIEVAERVGREASPKTRENMRKHFITTSKMEYMFWDMGWRRETWPL